MAETVGREVRVAGDANILAILNNVGVGDESESIDTVAVALIAARDRVPRQAVVLLDGGLFRVGIEVDDAMKLLADVPDLMTQELQSMQKLYLDAEIADMSKAIAKASTPRRSVGPKKVQKTPSSDELDSADDVMVTTPRPRAEALAKDILPTPKDLTDEEMVLGGKLADKDTDTEKEIVLDEKLVANINIFVPTKVSQRKLPTTDRS